MYTCEREQPLTWAALEAVGDVAGPRGVQVGARGAGNGNRRADVAVVAREAHVPVRLADRRRLLRPQAAVETWRKTSHASARFYFSAKVIDHLSGNVIKSASAQVFTQTSPLFFVC